MNPHYFEIINLKSHIFIYKNNIKKYKKLVPYKTKAFKINKKI